METTTPTRAGVRPVHSPQDYGPRSLSPTSRLTETLPRSTTDPVVEDSDCSSKPRSSDVRPPVLWTQGTVVPSLEKQELH